MRLLPPETYINNVGASLPTLKTTAISADRARLSAIRQQMRGPKKSLCDQVLKRF